MIATISGKIRVLPLWGKVILGITAFGVLSLVGLFGLAFVLALGDLIDSEDKQSDAEVIESVSTVEPSGFIMRGTVCFEDRESSKLLSNSSDAGTVYKRLKSEGKAWSFDHNLRIAILEGSPKDELVKVALTDWKDRRTKRAFWISGEDYLARTHSFAQFAMDGSKMVSQRDFKIVLNGQNEVRLRQFSVRDFAFLVELIYKGMVSEEAAKKCLIFPESTIGKLVFCSFEYRLKNRLIYSVGQVGDDVEYDIAVIRDESLETRYSDPNDLYREMKPGTLHGADPMWQGGMVFNGFEDFTTQNGTVRRIPVFRIVNPQP